jgi:hypothetical protein
MKITEPIRQHLLKVLQDRGMSQAEFARQLGHHKTWATRLLKPGKGALKRLEEDDKDAIEELLGIMLETFEDSRKPFPQLALDIAAALESRPDLAPVFSQLLTLAEPKTVYAVPHFSNKALLKLGARASRIVHEWDEYDEPHYTKIGLEIAVLIRELAEAEVA